VDTLHEEIKHLVGHLVENDVETLHEEKNRLVGFNFTRVYRGHLVEKMMWTPCMKRKII
jgi:hypothetical protein